MDGGIVAIDLSQLGEFIGFADKLGVVACLVALVIAFARRWIVSGDQHRELKDELAKVRETNERLHEQLYRATGIADRAVGHASTLANPTSNPLVPVNQEVLDEIAALRRAVERRGGR